MTRSLSFTYLFIILAVSYLGGTLLFRELSTTYALKMLAIFDTRVVEGDEASFLMPILTTLLFFVLAFVFAIFKYSRFLVLFTGAFKCVIFGVCSGYLLAEGMKIVQYTIWWFPFQFLICFTLLMYCAILTPPFFLRTTGKKERNNRALGVLAIIAVTLIVLESAIFYFFIS